RLAVVGDAPEGAAGQSGVGGIRAGPGARTPLGRRSQGSVSWGQQKGLRLSGATSGSRRTARGAEGGRPSCGPACSRESAFAVAPCPSRQDCRAIGQFGRLRDMDTPNGKQWKWLYHYLKSNYKQLSVKGTRI